MKLRINPLVAADLKAIREYIEANEQKNRKHRICGSFIKIIYVCPSLEKIDKLLKLFLFQLRQLCSFSRMTDDQNHFGDFIVGAAAQFGEKMNGSRSIGQHRISGLVQCLDQKAGGNANRFADIIIGNPMSGLIFMCQLLEDYDQTRGLAQKGFFNLQV